MTYTEPAVTLYNKSCRTMTELADNSVQVCITSPPYFGLRKYKADDEVWGGDPNCQHVWLENTQPAMGGVI